MEHNPPRAREHAAKCKLIAETAGSPTIQKTFFDLANKWVKLAEELDDARWLLNRLTNLTQRRPHEVFNLLCRPTCLGCEAAFLEPDAGTLAGEQRSASFR